MSMDTRGKYKPYPAYKNSEVQWLGEVPEHWNCFPLKYNTSIITGYAFSSDDFKNEGIPVLRIGDINKEGQIDFSNAKYLPKEFLLLNRSALIKKNDIVMAMTGATIGKAGRYQYEEPALLNQRVCVFRTRPENNQAYIWYILNTQFYAEHIAITAFGGAQPNISDTELLACSVPVPPLKDQSAIASFLDRKTAKINTLITEQERLIELLQEKRIALISHAVTKGINPDAPMKDPGIEWLGEVPAHWEVKPLKHIIKKIESGTSVNATDEPAKTGNIGVLKTSCVYSGQFNPYENKTVIETEIGRVSCPLKAGTLIVSRMNTPDLVGATGLVTNTVENLYLPDRLWQVNFSGANPAYVYYWTQSNLYRGLIRVVCVGTSSSMQNLGQDQFKAFVFPAPPLGEQDFVVTFLDRETAKIGTLIAKARQAIDLLKERRTALISAAVTGKIDVRDTIN